MIHSSQVQMQLASVKLLDDLNTICGQFLKPNGSFITKCLVTWFKIRCTRLIPSRTLRKYLWPLCLSFRGFLLLQLFLRFEMALLKLLLKLVNFVLFNFYKIDIFRDVKILDWGYFRRKYWF